MGDHRKRNLQSTLTGSYPDSGIGDGTAPGRKSLKKNTSPNIEGSVSKHAGGSPVGAWEGGGVKRYPGKANKTGWPACIWVNVSSLTQQDVSNSTQLLGMIPRRNLLILQSKTHVGNGCNRIITQLSSR